MIVFDIETNDYLNDWTFAPYKNGFVGEDPELLAIGFEDLVDREIHSECEDWEGNLAVLSDANALIGHNIISYDLPFLKRFYGWEPQPGTKILDTYVLSRLIEPESKPHRLEAWGERLGIQKVRVDNFTEATSELLKARVESDIQITTKLWFYLKDKAANGAFKQAYALEQRVQAIISEQEQTGVCFDVELAAQNVDTLNHLMTEIEKEVEPQLPQRKLPKSQLKHPPKKKFLKSGEPSKLAKDYFGDSLHKVDTDEGEEWVVKFPLDGGLIDFDLLANWDTPLTTHEPMRLSNKADIKAYLQEQGWVPTLFNIKDGVKTSPKIRDTQGNICPNLLLMGEEIPNIKRIVEWNTYAHRRNTILSDNGTGLLVHPRLKWDGRLPAGADTLGAVTGRMTHRVVANIPRSSSLFGTEMRRMFCAGPGKVLVGWDAASLEDRMKAHYVYPYNPEYAAKLLDPAYNVHDENCQLWFGLTPEDPDWDLKRALCKNGQFALTYGCQAPKLAQTLKMSKAKGEQLYDAWWELNKPLLLFKQDCEREWKENGDWVEGLDGRRLTVRKQHAIVNTKCQSAGIIVMKTAMVQWYDKIKELQLDAHQVIHYHDEGIAECPPSIAEQVGELGVLSIVKAGEMLNLNVPLSGEYKIGQTWADVH